MRLTKAEADELGAMHRGELPMDFDRYQHLFERSILYGTDYPAREFEGLVPVRDSTDP